MTANNPPALVFNSGLAYMVDSDAVPTPTNIKILQSANLDLKASLKELFGQNILPVAVGRSQIKVSGKIKFADYQPRLFRDFFGSSMSAGETLIAPAEAGTVPGSSTYTVTVTNSATWVTDLGVRYAATGIPLTRVASVAAVGQYSVAAGVYTFYSGDASANVLIDYTYTLSTAGETVTLSNTSAGAATTFKTVLGGSYNGLQTNFIINACAYESLKGYDSKLGDFAMPELDFAAFADSTGTLGTISFPVTS